jgi:hypothetical protein
VCSNLAAPRFSFGCMRYAPCAIAALYANRD